MEGLRVEFYQHDFIPAFAAFRDDDSTPVGKAFCVLNVGAFMAAVKEDDLLREDLPYFIAETMMHEVIHALEKWAGVEFDEERVEALLERYRLASVDTHPKGGDREAAPAPLSSAVGDSRDAQVLSGGSPNGEH